MANPNDRGESNPQSTSHPRMAAGIPASGQGRPQTEGNRGLQESRGVAASLSDAASKVRDKVEDVASGVSESASEAWESTKHRVQRGATAVAEVAESAWKDLQSLIRRYPVASVGIAFGLGCLCTGLLRGLSGPRDMTRLMSRHSA
jgi:ElaB/YqjD/DUF883 family membrane-anchored ribosome-binding protein